MPCTTVVDPAALLSGFQCVLSLLPLNFAYRVGLLYSLGNIYYTHCPYLNCALCELRRCQCPGQFYVHGRHDLRARRSVFTLSRHPHPCLTPSRLREYVALPRHTPLYTRPRDHPGFLHTSIVPHQGFNSSIIRSHPLRHALRSRRTAGDDGGCLRKAWVCVMVRREAGDRDAVPRHEHGIPYEHYVS